MSDAQPDPERTTVNNGATGAPQPEVARGELVPDPPASDGQDEVRTESVDEPAKVMRIGSMIKQLLEEVRTAELDAPARGRLREIYDTSVQELGSALSSDLREELERVAIPFGDGDDPSHAELRVAQAQLVGWLEGLFHGIQATLFAQQMTARHQLEDMRRQLPPGAAPGGPGGPGRPSGPGNEPPPGGTYL